MEISGRNDFESLRLTALLVLLQTCRPQATGARAYLRIRIPRCWRERLPIEERPQMPKIVACHPPLLP